MMTQRYVCAMTLCTLFAFAVLGNRSALAADTQAPTVPTGFTATAVSGTQINLAWNVSTDSGGSGLAGYKIERCQGSSCSSYTQIATSVTNSYSDTGRTPSTTYRYRIRAYDNASNNSAYTSVQNATTQAVDTTAPTVPTGLTGAATSSTQIDLSWNVSTDSGGSGLAGYKVERCQGSNCSTYSQINTTTSNGYSDTGLSPSTTYRYRIRAYDNAANNSAYTTAITKATPAPPDTQAPTTPATISATSPSTSEIDISWGVSTDNVGVTAYLLERCQGAACIDFAQVTSRTTRTYADTALPESTTYRYRVRARDAANNMSGYSTIVSATTQSPPDHEPPSAPGAISVSATSGTTAVVSWAPATDNVGIGNYIVQRCTGAGCTNFVSLQPFTPSPFNDSGLTGATEYSYRVMAFDTSGNIGPLSGVASVFTWPTGSDKVYRYDSQGRLVSTVDSAGRTVQYTYDAAGHAVAIQPNP